MIILGFDDKGCPIIKLNVYWLWDPIWLLFDVSLELLLLNTVADAVSTEFNVKYYELFLFMMMVNVSGVYEGGSLKDELHLNKIVRF